MGAHIRLLGSLNHLNLFYSYESMKELCDKYNRAMDSILQLVSSLPIEMQWICLMYVLLSSTVEDDAYNTFEIL